MVESAATFQAFGDLPLGATLAANMIEPARPVELLHLGRLRPDLIHVEEDATVSNQPVYPPEEILLLLVGQVVDRQAGYDDIELGRRFERARAAPIQGAPGMYS